MNLLLLLAGAAGVFWLSQRDAVEGSTSVSLSNGDVWTWSITDAADGYDVAFGRETPGFTVIWRKAPDNPYPTVEAATAAAKAQIELWDPQTSGPRVAASGTRLSGSTFAWGDFAWSEMPTQWRVILDRDDNLYRGQLLDESVQPPRWLSVTDGRIHPPEAKLLAWEFLAG